MELLNLEKFVSKNGKFDFNAVINILMKTEIKIKNIEIFIENQTFLETNLNIVMIRNMIGNLPFFPDNIIDIHCPFLKIRIFPSMIKVKKI